MSEQELKFIVTSEDLRNEFIDKLVSAVLFDVLKMQLEIMEESDNQSEREYSANIVVCAKSLLEYYGVTINFKSEEDKSKSTKKAKGRSGSRKVRNKKGRE